MAVNPQLSRRVGRVMDVIGPTLTPESRLQFQEAIESASSFEQLPAYWRQVVLDAEAKAGIKEKDAAESKAMGDAIRSKVVGRGNRSNAMTAKMSVVSGSDNDSE